MIFLTVNWNHTKHRFQKNWNICLQKTPSGDSIATSWKLSLMHALIRTKSSSFESRYELNVKRLPWKSKNIEYIAQAYSLMNRLSKGWSKQWQVKRTFLGSPILLKPPGGYWHLAWGFTHQSKLTQLVIVPVMFHPASINSPPPSWKWV